MRIFIVMLALILSTTAFAGGKMYGKNGGAGKGSSSYGKSGSKSGYMGGANENFQYKGTGSRPMDGTGSGYGDGTHPMPQDGTGFGRTGGQQ